MMCWSDVQTNLWHCPLLFHSCRFIPKPPKNRRKFSQSDAKTFKKVLKNNPRRKSIAETFVSPKRWNVSVLFQHSFIPKRSNNWWNIRQSDAERSKKNNIQEEKNAETFVNSKRWNVSALFCRRFIPKPPENHRNISQSDAKNIQKTIREGKAFQKH